MNYMKQVAQMLGLELEEEFYLKGIRNKYKITNDGMFYHSKKGGIWLIKSWTLNKVLTGKLEIIKEPKPILDEAEKRYLSNVIKPFRDCVKCILKDRIGDYEYIRIIYYDKLTLDSYDIEFPAFKAGTMYEGMELYKKYSVEDLGI